MLKIKGSSSSPPTIAVYPGYGHHANSNRNSDWLVRVSGVVYHVPEEFSVRKRMLIRMLRNVMQVPPQAFDSSIFRQRIAPFMADAHHRLPIVVKFGDQEFRLDKKTRRNGHFESWLRLPASLVDELQVTENGVAKIKYEVAAERGSFDPVEGQAYLHQRNGICVISDIDDTIKHSVVTDRRELLANTFLREFRGIAGMSKVYQDWSASGADFHYVSSSPWQLFESLREMQGSAGFPLGTLHLRNFRLRDQLLKKVLIIRRPGKVIAIRSILKNLPDRKFVLIGDSGEKDPEIYAKICRQFPGRVLGLFIRELSERRLDPERLAKFRDNLNVRFEAYESCEQLAELAEPIMNGKSHQ